MIPFNKPYFTGNETSYIEDSVRSGKISGNGKYTQMCHRFFESEYGFKKCLLTTSCTDALEMAAILCNLKPGDEVIIPSYTFVSTALAFDRQGAKIIFADSKPNHPNIDEDKIESLITDKTKVIVPVHYAGVSCNMEKIMTIAEKYNLLVVEDAAQAIDSFYKGKPLGSFGHFACFSFHETKNIIAGEGGMLVINEIKYSNRAEIIWEKGTNRSEFFRGEVNKYGWKDTGSSFLPSEIIAAFLYSQIENIAKIQLRRKEIWEKYYQQLAPLQESGFCKLPEIPHYASNNAHMFYVICNSLEERTKLIRYLKDNEINAVFHYQSLHKSEYYSSLYEPPMLLQSDKFHDTLLRLPFFYELTDSEIQFISEKIICFFK